MAATARLRREEAAQCAGKASQRRGAWLRIRRRRCRIRPFRGWIRPVTTGSGREAHSDVELNDFQDKMEVELQGCHALQ
ncbi:hypothetical protein OsJ_30859 [Oryza sativa Japonica Group]|uniref:Uncharacterized protein n=1 Tax=Oryza sativa subsp. japonica TaxID=39947 RepID=B9G7Q7_ORYSJ|nr:hypothetical protein OsJ_30859 [Oryza sativa Japonica Group]